MQCNPGRLGMRTSLLACMPDRADKATTSCLEVRARKDGREGAREEP